LARIVVLDGYTVNPGDNPWTALEDLGEFCVYDRTLDEDIVARAAGAQILLTNKTPLSAESLARLPDVRGIGVLATGVNVVDVGAATARGIPVCNVPSYSTASVVQHTFALLLELCHRVGLHDQTVKAGEWQNCADFCYWKSPLLELQGKQLGIVGYGLIGQRVASVARALGMSVCAAQLRPQTAPNDAVPRLGLDDLFSQADVISLHCPLTPETRGLVSKARLARMKASALLVNTARGGLVDEAALRAALDAGLLAGAALDVLSTEPPSADNPLLGAKNCLITPHIAWTSIESRQRLLATTVDNVRALLAGSPINVVNPTYQKIPAR